MSCETKIDLQNGDLTVNVKLQQKEKEKNRQFHLDIDHTRAGGYCLPCALRWLYIPTRSSLRYRPFRASPDTVQRVYKSLEVSSTCPSSSIISLVERTKEEAEDVQVKTELRLREISTVQVPDTRREERRSCFAHEPLGLGRIGQLTVEKGGKVKFDLEGYVFKRQPYPSAMTLKPASPPSLYKQQQKRG